MPRLKAEYAAVSTSEEHANWGLGAGYLGTLVSACLADFGRPSPAATLTVPAWWRWLRGTFPFTKGILRGHQA